MSGGEKTGGGKGPVEASAGVAGSRTGGIGDCTALTVSRGADPGEGTRHRFVSPARDSGESRETVDTKARPVPKADFVAEAAFPRGFSLGRFGMPAPDVISGRLLKELHGMCYRPVGSDAAISSIPAGEHSRVQIGSAL